MFIKTIKKYLAFTKINLKSTIEYRGAMFFWLIGDMFTTLVMINLWLASDASTFTGFTKSSLITYYLASLLMQWLVGWGAFHWISDDIKTGQISFTFKSPISVFFSGFFQEAGWHIVSTAVALFSSLFIVLVYYGQMSLNFSFTAILLTLCAIPGAIIITYAANICMAAAAFWFTEVSSLPTFYWLGRNLLGGRVLPIVFLPGVILLVSKILPFRYMFSFPLELLFSQLNSTEIVIGFVMQLVWSVLLFLLYRLLWAKGRRRYASFGN